MENSLLAKLPPELRNRIYDFALTSPDPFILVASPLHEGVRQQPETARKHPLALTATCKAIRAECLKLYYANNAFEVCAPIERDATGAALLKNFREAIGTDNAAALRSITVDAGRVCLDLIGHLNTPVDRFGDLVYDVLQESERFATACRISIQIDFDYQDYSEREKVGIELDLRNLTSSWITAARILHDKTVSARTDLEASTFALLGSTLRLWKVDIDLKSFDSKKLALRRKGC